MKSILKTSIIFSGIIFLSACGGGTSNDSTSTAAEEETLVISTETEPSLTDESIIDDPVIQNPGLSVVPAEVSAALNLPDISHNYSDPDLPAHFNTAQVQGFDNTPLDNIVTDEIATLGRVLFYEKQLSANATVACASCHLQVNGFSDPNQFSIGFQGVTTPRNSMGLANSKYYERGHFFWDERADTLEDQVLEPIQNQIEI